MNRMTKILVYWIIIKMGIIYILYGLSMLLIHPPVLTSGTASLMRLMPGATQEVAGILFLLSGIFTLVAIVIKKLKLSMVFNTPMLFILIYGTYNSINSAYLGVYSNGYIPDIHSHIFIGLDQLLPASTLITYILALVLNLAYKDN